MDHTAIARSVGLPTAAQILATRPRREVWCRCGFGCEGDRKQAYAHGLRSPWQNGVAERWVGSCRRDLLDHVIVLNERHLKRLMSSYLLYYHEDRTHLGLAKDTPTGRPTAIRPKAERKIQSFPRLGGLHHRLWVTSEDFPRQRQGPVASACTSNPMPRTEGWQARRSVRKR